MQFPQSDIKPGPMQTYFAFFLAHANPREGAQVGEGMFDGCMLHRRLQIMDVAVFKFITYGFSHTFDIRHPLADEITFRQRIATIHNGTNAATTAMAHDNHVRYSQRQHGKFNGCTGGMVLAIRRIGRHQVGHIAQNENLAGARIEYGFGCCP